MKITHYTPITEELHEGFEYQFRVGSVWVDMVYDEGQALKGREFENMVRVKYLDREAIEGLGFKFKKEGDAISYTVLTFTKNIETAINTGTDYTITFDPKPPNISGIPDTLYLSWVSYGCFGGEEGGLRLKIKNKSELKTLIKQLKI